MVQWETVIIESSILATIIFGAVFVENLMWRRMHQKQDNAVKKDLAFAQRRPRKKDALY